MTEAAIRNIISSEFRAMQQRMNDRMITRADLSTAFSQQSNGNSTITKQDMMNLKASLDEIKFELKSQRQVLRQQAAYIESLDRGARTHTNQLGSLWRFVQQ